KNMPGVAGGTAVDVLRSTPAVEVDGSDAVSLRGNANVVIQINGRATPLKGDQLAQFLKQLPTAAVDRVEVATNPNAKSDPEGTAGIINIVLRGDVEIGLSARINASTSTTGSAVTNGNVARQSGPLTLSLSGGLSRDRRTLTGALDRTYLVTPVPASLSSRTTGSTRPRTYNLGLRGEYKLTERDLLSSESSVFSGEFPRSSVGDFRDYDASQLQIGEFLQLSQAVQGNHGQDASITYRHMPTPSLTSLSVELRYFRNRYINDNAIGSRLLQADASTVNVATSDQRDLVGGLLPALIAQADWTHPFGELAKLEAGGKQTWRRTEADATSSLLDPATGVYVDLPERATASRYREQIGAVYAVLSEKAGSFLLQQGLRLEQTDASFVLPLTDGASDFTTRYGSAFPSAIVTYNASPTRSVRASYARRISRPWPQLLSPVPIRSDQRSVFQGNPALQPEFTDAYELNLQDAQPWGSLQLNPYVRRSAHAFRNIRRVDSAGVSTSTFANVASTLSQGLDVSVSFHRGPFTVNGGGGTYHFSSDAGALGPAYSVRTQVWNVRVNATARLRPTTTAQFFTTYRGAAKTEGGSSLPLVFMNGGIRQQLWGGKGDLNLGVSDPFGLTKFGSRLDDGRVLETSEGTFGLRQVTLSISRTFGQDVRLKERITQTESGPPAGTTP
ncbi:MAG: TonB-dependent receptor, partial [Gemmatimonadetes bacterium]|nr:TonB-dependent receptor [Gemmatimonadota bacterium]